MSRLLAHESPSDELKRTLEPLRARHSNQHILSREAAYHGNDLAGRLQNPDAASQDAVHPVVIGHPETGRKSLSVNQNFTTGIEGWTPDESAAFLGFLCEHGARPEFTCRFRWQPGSIAVWDNRSTWHCAVNDYQGQRRLMHRVTVAGVPLQ